jgi:hypothetical protein
MAEPEGQLAGTDLLCCLAPTSLVTTASCQGQGARVVTDAERIRFEGHVQGWACASCNEVYYEGADLGAFEETAATWLAEHGVRTPEELEFMRKAAGIRAADLATWLARRYP